MIALLLQAALANPTSVKLDYRVTFDLDAQGDRMCKLAGICDCSTVYVGEGKLVPSTPGHLTFQGTFAVRENTCNDAFAIWVPADGRAFHTFTVGSMLTEWLVHRDAQATKRTSAIKENGQFWIDGWTQAWPVKTASMTQTETGDLGLGMKVKTTHVLAVDFAGADQAR